MEEKAVLGGVLLRLIDTAGLRETEDAVERLGVERSRRALEQADLILVLADGTKPFGEEEHEALRLAAESGRPWLLLHTKRDLGCVDAAGETSIGRTGLAAEIEVSSVTHEGFDTLAEAVAALYPTPEAGGTLLTNARQADAVARALEAVRAAKGALSAGMTPDVVLTEAEGALAALGELTGRTAREDMVARIFERFCVGK